MTPTPAQQAAIDSNATDILCVAGPGSGKTQTTVERIRRLIETGTPPARIVALTFTNAAANELQERIYAEKHEYDVKVEELQEPIPIYSTVTHLGYTGTLHGFAFRCLREHGALLGYGPHLTVISPESAQDLLEQKAKELSCRDTIKRLLEIKAAGLDTTKRMTVAETTVASFLQELKQASIVDFDILLTEFARLVREFPHVLAGRWDHLFVDEVQDSSALDWQIYRGLPIPNKFMVGDSDQSIYGFRGAAVAEMVTQLQVFPHTQLIMLEANFRSLEPICRAAQALIEHNAGRIPKATISTRGDGVPVAFLPPAANEGEEIGIVSRKIGNLLMHPQYDPNEIAVIARTNAIAGAFAKTLAAVHIPVRQRKKSDLPRDWPAARALVEFLADPDNDTLAFLWLCARNQAPSAHLMTRTDAHRRLREAAAAGTTINAAFQLTPYNLQPGDAPAQIHRAGLSKECAMVVVERLRLLQPVATMADLALLLAQPEPGIDEEGEGVHCLTIHAAKGREFGAVFLVGFEEETIPGKRKKVDIEEERRLAYVGATRAKDFLAISYAQSRVTPWGSMETCNPSRFIHELCP